MKNCKKIAVLMGGCSSEREISLHSGGAVLRALQEQGVDAHGVDVGAAPPRLDGFDGAFLALHGRGGEDGAMQGYLETLGIPYTGSGVLGCALSMDKLRSKQIWRDMALPTPPWALLDAGSDLDAVVAELGLPLAVKPAAEGSSVGVFKVERAADLPDALRRAAAFAAPVLAEPWIAGGEYTVGILDDAALPVVRIETPRGFYDFEAKYRAADTGYHCPSGLSAQRERAVQALALAAFRALGCAGWGRVDLMIDEQERPWLLEVNAAPGMTDHSLVPMAARAAGIDFGPLTLRILAGGGR